MKATIFKLHAASYVLILCTVRVSAAPAVARAMVCKVDYNSFFIFIFSVNRSILNSDQLLMCYLTEEVCLC